MGMDRVASKTRRSNKIHTIEGLELKEVVSRARGTDA